MTENPYQTSSNHIKPFGAFHVKFRGNENRKTDGANMTRHPAPKTGDIGIFMGTLNHLKKEKRNETQDVDSNIGNAVVFFTINWLLVGGFNPSEKYDFVNWDD